MTDPEGPWTVIITCPKCGQKLESAATISHLDKGRDRALDMLLNHKYSCPKEAKTSYAY